MDDDERKQIRDEFDEAVTMTASRIEEWLESDDSRAVGQKDDDGHESTGHASGRRIVQILRKRRAELADERRRAPDGGRDVATLERRPGIRHRTLTPAVLAELSRRASVRRCRHVVRGSARSSSRSTLGRWCPRPIAAVSGSRTSVPTLEQQVDTLGAFSPRAP